MKFFKNFSPQGEFEKNVITLMTGTTIAQSIPIAISPILTRIYTPEDFGILALFFSITSIFASIANGRYELSIMLPKKDEDAINIFALGFIITTLISIFLLLIVVFFHDIILSFLTNKQISFWLYFIPLVVFLIGFYNNLNYLSYRKKNYKELSKTKIIKAIITSVVQLLIGYIKIGATGLLTGQFLSNFFANIILLKSIIKNNAFFPHINKETILKMAKKYNNFPKFSIFSTLINSLSLQSINILITIFYTSATLGFYSLVNKIMNLPALLIGGSISQVYFQEATLEFQKNKNTNIIFIKTFKTLLIISLPIFVTVYFIVEPTFAFIFGEKWRIAGVYAKTLTPLASVRFISSALSVTTTIHQKLIINLIINIILFATVLIIFIIGEKFQINFLKILSYYSLILSLEYLSFIFIYHIISNKKI